MKSTGSNNLVLAKYKCTNADFETERFNTFILNAHDTTTANI